MSEKQRDTPQAPGGGEGWSRAFHEKQAGRAARGAGNTGHIFGRESEAGESESAPSEAA